MCGLFAIVGNSSEQALDTESLLASLRHRGPDDHGWLAWDGQTVHKGREPRQISSRVLLGHTRLAILDLSPGGQQPMVTSDGRFAIVYNGEVYNYLELRLQLEAEGLCFRTGTDTEVVLAAFACRGLAALAQFRGMFAFVVLDLVARRVYAVRDFFGIKPLFHCRWRGGIAFASEIATLLELPGVRREVNPERAFAYLRFGATDHGNDTLFAGIHQVECGTVLEVNLETGTLESRRYWQLAETCPLDISFAEATARLRELFFDNIREHIRSDVPVGVALSGGLDSSTIVCALRHLRPGQDIHTFSFIDQDPAVSELPWVERVARHAKVVSWKVTPADGELQADLPRLVRHQGEPFGSTSIYAQYRVFQLARENGIKVMLEGQGADEVLAGYIVYQGARLASLLRQGAWRKARSFLARSARQHPQRPTRLLLQYAGLILLPHAPAVLLRRLSGRAIIPPWLNAAWFAERDVAVGPSAAPIGSHGLQVRNHLKVALRESLTAGLPRLLRHGDRNAMAFSIENRVPFLTVELVEFLLTLPEFYLLSDRGVSKHVLREAFRGIVPDEVLDRRDKVGFVTSQARWLTQGQGWLDKRLRRAEEFDLFDGPGLKALDPVRQSDFAWRICNLVEWCDIFGVAVPAAVRSRRSNLRAAA